METIVLAEKLPVIIDVYREDQLKRVVSKNLLPLTQSRYEIVK